MYRSGLFLLSVYCAVSMNAHSLADDTLSVVCGQPYMKEKIRKAIAEDVYEIKNNAMQLLSEETNPKAKRQGHYQRIMKRRSHYRISDALNKKWQLNIMEFSGEVAGVYDRKGEMIYQLKIIKKHLSSNRHPDANGMLMEFKNKKTYPTAYYMFAKVAPNIGIIELEPNKLGDKIFLSDYSLRENSTNSFQVEKYVCVPYSTPQ